MIRHLIQKWALRKVEPELQALRRELDFLRSKLDVPAELVEAFLSERAEPAYQAAFEEVDPLVSVCVGTFNRMRLLTERCLPSLLSQSYRNLEILVVGDACTDGTAERIAALCDPRIHFLNLSQRGAYPMDPHLRWMVAGSTPVNMALGMAKGSWITHLDDDDEYDSERIEKLLVLARKERADVVYHPFDYEKANGKWAINPADGFRKDRVSTSSVFYHHWLRCLPWDLKAYEYREPGDWNRFRKMLYLGVRVARHPDRLLRHYRERNNAS
jgi:glycosyltransferase involved in cell wall biosynthesis